METWLEHVQGQVAAASRNKNINRPPSGEIAMTTTPQQPPRTENQPRLPHVAQTSAALEEVKALKMLILELRGEILAVSESLQGARNEIKVLHSQIATHVEEAREGYKHVIAAPQPAAAPVATTTKESQYTEIVEATELRPAVMTNGKVYARVFGGRYTKLGIPLYPEHYGKVGVNENTVKAGAQPFDARVVVEMKVNAEGEMQPRRIIGLAQ